MHEGICESFTECRLGVVWNVETTSTLNDRPVPHVSTDVSEGLGEDRRDGTIDGRRVEKPRPVGQRLAVGAATLQQAEALADRDGVRLGDAWAAAARAAS